MAKDLSLQMRSNAIIVIGTSSVLHTLSTQQSSTSDQATRGNVNAQTSSPRPPSQKQLFARNRFDRKFSRVLERGRGVLYCSNEDEVAPVSVTARLACDNYVLL